MQAVEALCLTMARVELGDELTARERVVCITTTHVLLGMLITLEDALTELRRLA